MPGTEELMARLQQLEDGYYGDKEEARRNAFMDKYGAKWKNDRGLGLTILNELDRQGVDTSAADEAVQSILDQLRTEVQELADLITDVQDTATEKAEQIDKVANSVEQAIAQNPETTTDFTANAEMEFGAESPMEEAPVDQGAESPMEEAPVDQGAEPPMEAAPVDQGAEPPMEAAPVDQGTLSDARLKRVKSIYAQKHTQRARNNYKPSTGILAAAMGGR